MSALLDRLGRRNRFAVHAYTRGHMFFPAQQEYARQLAGLRPADVYVNHAAHLSNTNHTLWINVVREPVDRWNSLYNYRRSLRT